MEKIIIAIKLVYRKLSFRILTAILFLVIFILYLFLLPSTFTGGKIGFFSLQFLTIQLIFFSFALALFFSVSITFLVYSFRSGLKIKTAPQNISGMILALLPGMLCCTPVIPSILAILGASTPFLFRFSGPIQGFLTTYSTYFLTLSLMVVIWAFYLSAKNLVAVCSPKRSSIE